MNYSDYCDLVRVRVSHVVDKVWEPLHSCAPNVSFEDWKLIGMSRNTLQKSFELHPKTEGKLCILLNIPLKR